MIVVDTSALSAIFFDEVERELFQNLIGKDDQPILSAVNHYETMVVLRSRIGAAGTLRFALFVREAGFLILHFDDVQARLAAEAYARYGKGLGSKAQLNLCDCAAYALARHLDAPLLFKGEDFSHTDVRRCV